MHGVFLEIIDTELNLILLKIAHVNIEIKHNNYLYYPYLQILNHAVS